jgi:RES domain-containing protein
VAEFKKDAVTLKLWRAVEAQHRVSTMALVDTLEEQALLEHILDDSKPALDPGLKPLHYLLFTPFRYPPLPNGSRFRSATDPGVFYGAEAGRTACAELGYWRWRLLMDSPQIQSIPPVQQTLFRISARGDANNGPIQTITPHARNWLHKPGRRASKLFFMNLCETLKPAHVLRCSAPPLFCPRHLSKTSPGHWRYSNIALCGGAILFSKMKVSNLAINKAIYS